VSVSILDARAKLAAVLAPLDDDEPPLYDNLVDAIHPPCIMLGWRIPMIDWAGQTPCTAFGTLGLTLVGGRIDAAGGVEAIESMYDTVQRRLRADSQGWAMRTDGGIVRYEIGNVLYLACRVDVRVPLAVG